MEAFRIYGVHEGITRDCRTTFQRLAPLLGGRIAPGGVEKAFLIGRNQNKDPPDVPVVRSFISVNEACSWSLAKFCPRACLTAIRDMGPPKVHTARPSAWYGLPYSCIGIVIYSADYTSQEEKPEASIHVTALDAKVRIGCVSTRICRKYAHYRAVIRRSDAAGIQPEKRRQEDTLETTRFPAISQDSPKFPATPIP